MGNKKTGIAVAILLFMAIFAIAPAAEARTDLRATSYNTNALYTLTYTQPSPSYIPWAPYKTSAGVYKGDLLKWSYVSGLDTDSRYRKSLSISSYWGTITGVNMADTDGGLYGECVSFVKSVAKSSISTQYGGWMKGRPAIQPLPSTVYRGTAIATFMSNGQYDSDGSITKNNHVAIFDKYYYENGVVKGIWVWDQNFVYGCVWPCGKGLVGHHMIRITNTGKMDDAAAYYAVTV